MRIADSGAEVDEGRKVVRFRPEGRFQDVRRGGMLGVEEKGRASASHSCLDLKDSRVARTQITYIGISTGNRMIVVFIRAPVCGGPLAVAFF